MCLLVFCLVSVAAPAVFTTGVTAAAGGPAPARVVLPPEEFGPEEPGPVLGAPDEATVLRGPEFVRGAARSGDSLIAASRGRTCAVRRDARVTCWGYDGIRERLSAAGLRNVVSVTSGDHPHQELHLCALHGDGTVSCWGAGREGQLGRGEPFSGYLPEKVPGISDAVALAAGSDHTCVVHARGQVSCWGSGALGQLGGATLASVAVPERVPDIADAAWIDAGPSSNCVIDTGGALTCWGYGGGAGNFGAFSPAAVTGLPAVVSVSTGADRTCAVTVAGEVYCWPVADVADPQRVDGVGGAISVAVGDGGVCVVHDDGGVSCWGEKNAAGQLGDGTTAPRQRPARVAGVVDAVAVTMSAGSTRLAPHACAAHGDGSYSCWGGNSAGQLGDGSLGRALSPVPVPAARAIPANRIPTDETDLLRSWLDEAVAEREADFPWLRLAWNRIRERTIAGRIEDFRGAVRSYCELVAGLYGCWSEHMEVAEMTFGVAVHELAHVYDSTTSLSGGPAWGAVQLYFAWTYPDCFRDYGQRSGAEILADTMAHLVVPAAWLAYHGAGCPGVGGEPDREAERVVLAGLAGEVPAWYSENVTNGADLWRVLRRVLAPQLLANLGNEFGGFCSTDWFRYPLEPNLVPPPRTNPFRDGGC
ncbi:MAG: hypothetical protein F4X49_07670 [Acidimicrobiia bacterium]|nr:hypothetical protein [Acidimicrobiia bacterium]